LLFLDLNMFKGDFTWSLEGKQQSLCLIYISKGYIRKIPMFVHAPVIDSLFLSTSFTGTLTETSGSLIKIMTPCAKWHNAYQIAFPILVVILLSLFSSCQGIITRLLSIFGSKTKTSYSPSSISLSLNICTLLSLA
jgi:hypothetical protein